MTIIGLTGVIGAGKGVVVEYLKSKGFAHFSAREYIEGELRKRRISVNRDAMIELANSLRREHSPGFIINELLKEALKSGKNSIIESIRNPSEIEKLKERGDFYLVAVDADRSLRYERVKKRGSATDNVSFDEFVAHEEREYQSVDPTAQNLKACMASADFVLHNDGTLDELHSQVDEMLVKIKK